MKVSACLIMCLLNFEIHTENLNSHVEFCKCFQPAAITREEKKLQRCTTRSKIDILMSEKVNVCMMGLAEAVKLMLFWFVTVKQ